MNRKGESDLVAEGHVVLACVSRSTFKSIVMPRELIDALRPYLVEAVAE